LQTRRLVVQRFAKPADGAIALTALPRWLMAAVNTAGRAAASDAMFDEGRDQGWLVTFALS
jgi:hypothetical protein